MNNIRFGFRLIAIPLIASLSACSVATNTPTSPTSIVGSTALTADAITATWKLQSIQPQGLAEMVAPAGAAYTITFADRLSVRADCNMCSSSYTIDGHTLSINTAMACTRAACPTMAFESQFEQMIAGTHEASLSGSTMKWTSPRGTLTFSR